MDNQLAAGSPPAMQFAGQQQQQQPTGFGAAANTKIFVGGLAWETKSDTLYRYFEQFGEIIEAVVITEKQTGRSKGYGFVTFVDTEAARRACANPNPIIDNRRANCNLASTARPAHLVPYGNLRSPTPRMGMLQSPRGPYAGNPMYQLPFIYGYQPGLPFSPYRYPAYGPEYLYPQMYGVHGISSPNAMLYGQLGNPQPTNSSYKSVRSYINPGPQMVQYGRPLVCGVTTGVIPMQSPYRSGFSAPTPGTSKVLVATSPQFTPGNKLSRQAE